MKKTFVKRVIILILAICMLAMSILPLKVLAFNPNADDTSVFTQYQDTILYFHPQAADEDVQSYTMAYKQLPSNVINNLKKANVKIYVLPYKGPDPGNATICASAYPPLYEIDPDTQQIIGVKRHGWIVCYTDLKSKYFYPEQLIYAVGCELDYVTAYADGNYTGIIHGFSDSEEWNQIYNVDNKVELAKIREYDELTQLNWPLTSADGFADAFRLYICHNEDLQQLSEMVFTFIDQSVNSASVYTIPVNTKDILDEEDKTAKEQANPEIKEVEESAIEETAEDISAEDIQKITFTNTEGETAVQEETKTDKRMQKPSFDFNKVLTHINNIGAGIKIAANAVASGFKRIGLVLQNAGISITKFWKGLTLVQKLIPVMAVIALGFAAALKRLIDNKKAAKQQKENIINKLKSAKVYTYDEINTWKNQKPAYGCYLLTNYVHGINKVAISHDLFNEIYEETENMGKNVSSINRARSQKFWKARYILLPANTDEGWLQQVLNNMVI